MSRLSISKRYAQAAFDLALESDALESWRQTLSELAVLLENQELQDYLEAPLVAESDKLAVLDTLLPDAPKLVHNLEGLILKNGLVSLLPLVVQEFHRLMDQQQGIQRATLTTAVPVDEVVVESIRSRLDDITGTKVEISLEVAPSILGGFIAQVGDRLIDGSTRDRLRQLRRRMISS